VHLYLHVPFCARRCSYCDFAIAVRRTVPSREFADAVLEEWQSWQDHPAWGGSSAVDTIYFGGGTPSVLDPGELARILDAIRARRPVAAGAEVTLEANPDDIRPDRVAAWRAAGINRISLGVQSFDPGVLAWMHRTHTAESIPEAMSLLRAHGFGNVSIDLIFALPAHLERDWGRDLDLAFALEPEHLSLYGLTVEDRTPLARWVARGETARPDDESYAAEFLQAGVALAAHGYERYEVSNAARPGFRARHNSAYWRRRPFIGLGPSAHSGLGNERRWNVREWAAYQAAIARGESPVNGMETLDAPAIALEDLYLGLRVREGVREDLVPPATVSGWMARGWAHRGGGRVRLTDEGWLRLDALVAAVEMPRGSPVA
jgi:oxygen-independent coproporphyrinogen-3 oxidase